MGCSSASTELHTVFSLAMHQNWFFEATLTSSTCN
jgi:hypothetical protein